MVQKSLTFVINKTDLFYFGDNSQDKGRGGGGLVQVVHLFKSKSNFDNFGVRKRQGRIKLFHKEKIIMDNKVNFSKYQYMKNNKITIHNNALKGGSERVLSDIE